MFTRVGSTPPAAAGATHPPATPSSNQPAAGICRMANGDVVTVELRPTSLHPLCACTTPPATAGAEQHGATVSVRLAWLETVLDPSEEHTFDLTLGSLLAPGVHRLGVSAPPGGAELWMGP